MSEPTRKFTPKDILKYRYKNFVPYLNDIENEKVYCGGHALTIITGIPLRYIATLHPKNHWEEKWVLTFLKLCHYDLLELRRDFYECRKGFEKLVYPDHLKLLLLGIDKRELTWAVAHNGAVYHAQHLFKNVTEGEVLLNCPVIRMWLVCPSKEAKYTKN
jgi:hypothetical protein